MIAIIDYQMGNLRSVQKGFEKVGHQATITSDPAVLAQADKIVLPGVGAFGDAMAELKRRNLVEPIRAGDRLRQAVSGHLPGPATAVRRGLRRRAPRRAGHPAAARSCGSSCPPNTKCRTWVGTNWRFAARRRSWRGLTSGTHCYFVHSYYVVPQDPERDRHRDRLSRRRFVRWSGATICSPRSFIPKRASAHGLRMLKNFAEL